MPSAEPGTTKQRDAALPNNTPVAFTCGSFSCFQGSWAELQSCQQVKVRMNRHGKMEESSHLVSLLMRTFRILPYVHFLYTFNSGIIQMRPSEVLQ